MDKKTAKAFGVGAVIGGIVTYVAVEGGKTKPVVIPNKSSESASSSVCDNCDCSKKDIKDAHKSAKHEYVNHKKKGRCDYEHLRCDTCPHKGELGYSFLKKDMGDSASDIIARYNLTGHMLVGGGHFREIVRTPTKTVMYYLLQHHDSTLHRLYNGVAEESIVWIAGDEVEVDDNGTIISLRQKSPSYVVKHNGKNWLDYNVPKGWALMTITFVPPFDPSKLTIKS